MFPMLETDRLKLRELTQADVAAIFHCLSNEEVTRFMGRNLL
ncbi:ribosomal-protein-alanine N-acetyltransferase [Lysinibacillus fusiformis]|nr:ribosomal-protein-alanine N-acetyltransferase [Lysinibacillus fusiformis]